MKIRFDIKQARICDAVEEKINPLPLIGVDPTYWIRTVPSSGERSDLSKKKMLAGWIN